LRKEQIMKRPYLWLIAGLAAPSAAPAAEPQQSNAEITLEYADFTRGYGERQVATLEYNMDFGDTTVVLSGSQGRREFEDETFNATRGSVAVYHDWSDHFYTRTSAAIATEDPVFPTVGLAHDFNLRVTSNVVLLAGPRYYRYFGGRDAISWVAGATYYFNGGFASYRYTGFGVEGLDTTHGHTISVRINDPRGGGFTQAWAGAGSAVQEYDALPDLFRGNYRSLSVRRFQPLSGRFALNLGLSHNWYDTGLVDYQGTTARVGLRFSH